MKFNKEMNFFKRTSDGGIFLDSPIFSIPILHKAHFGCCNYSPSIMALCTNQVLKT